MGCGALSGNHEFSTIDVQSEGQRWCSLCVPKNLRIRKNPKQVVKNCLEPYRSRFVNSLSYVTTQSSSLGVTAEYLRHFKEKHLPQSRAVKTKDLQKLFTTALTSELKIPVVDALDRKFVGKANVFVSHTYGSNVEDTIDVMLQYEENNPGAKFWFDPFSLNQNKEKQVVATQDLERAFGDQVKRIGKMLIVASPWKNPTFLTRSWCLFELLASAQNNIKIDIKLPKREEEDFIKTLSMNWKCIDDILQGIDSAKAQASIQADKKLIDKWISSFKKGQEEGGFRGLNSLAKTQIRDWFVKVVIHHETELEASSNAEKLFQAMDLDANGKVTQQEVYNFILRKNEKSMVSEMVEEEARALFRKYDLNKDKTIELFELKQVLKQLTSHLAVFRYHVSLFLHGAGYLEEAERSNRLALEFFVNQWGENNQNTVACLNNLAGIMMHREDYPQAEKYFSRAIEACKANMVGTQAAIWIDRAMSTTNNLAILLANQGKVAEARDLTQSVFEYRQKKLGRDNEKTLLCKANLATYTDQLGGNRDECEKMYKDCIQGFSRKNRPAKALEIKEKLADLYFANESFDDSEKIYLELYSSHKENKGDHHEDTIVVHGLLGRILVFKRADEESVARGVEMMKSSIQKLEKLNTRIDAVKLFREAVIQSSRA